MRFIVVNDLQGLAIFIGAPGKFLIPAMEMGASESFLTSFGL